MWCAAGAGLALLGAMVLGLDARGPEGPAFAAPKSSPFDLRPVAVLGPAPAASTRSDAAPSATPTSPVLYLPRDFSVTTYAKLGVSNARSVAVGETGVVYVSAPRYGLVEAYRDMDGDSFAEVQQTILSDLSCPYGLAVHDGWLYVAQEERVTRFPLHASGMAVSGPGEVLVDSLPRDPCQPHGYRPLAVSPEQGALYVAVGSSCNVCVEDGPGGEMRGKVWRYPLWTAGPGREFARGLRNLTDLTINPWDGTLWGVTPERDDTGDDLPEEIITEIREGADYGWPYCYLAADGSWQPDPRVDPPAGGCTDLTRPTLTYQAHTTPLGIAFHDGRGLPEAFGPSLFVALHGSAGHTSGVGYKIIRFPLDERGQPRGQAQEFALGWLAALGPYAPTAAWGRPVDLAVGGDGALYLTDDGTGVVYRLAHAPLARSP